MRSSPKAATVVVLGGYGVFGSRVVRSLVRHDEIDIVVAGRNRREAERFCAGLPAARVHPTALDSGASDVADRLLTLAAAVVVDSAGPFQRRDQSVPRACAEHGIHYIDLADDREWVCHIGELDSVAAENDVLIVSGASTVPALSTAVLDGLLTGLERITSVDVGISPGHRAPRGLATVQSILSYCGHPIPAFIARSHTTENGWGGLTRHRYPEPVGSRWLSNVDVPERALWPARYKTLETLRFRAGLEIGALHLGLAVLSGLVRAGLMSSLVPYASSMIRVADALNGWASDTGAMHVEIAGIHADSRSVRRRWTLSAERGNGPQIPATPAALLAKKLLGVPGYAPTMERGARPCVGLLSLAEIVSEWRAFAIRTQLDEEAIAIRG